MRKFLSLLLMSVFAFSVGWAVETVHYTLDPIAGSNNSYAGNCDITISGMTWNVTGNSTMIPWRLGGKNITETDRSVYSKTAMGSAITKVELKVGTATATVNSITFTVASDADFSNVIDTKSANFEANSTITFTPTSGTEWATGAYYKFTFNVTCGGSNQYVQFSAATFYKEAGDTPQPTTYSLTLPTGLTGGSVSSNVSNAASIAAGTSITVTATPDQGYVLDWMKANDTEVSNPYTFNIAQNTIITAAFKEEGTTPTPLNAFYTLTPEAGSENGYATNEDIEINGITWNVTGNSTLVPWRIGGKNLTSVNREVYSKTAMGSAISKVELDLGAITATLNSVTLTVASDANFSNVIGTVSKTGAANTTVTFQPTGSDWATDAYYKFTFNLNAGSSNQYVQFSEARFYAPGGDTPQPSEFPAPTFSFQENTLVENGDAVIVLPENATSLNYWYGTDSQNAIDNVVDQTATSDVVLDLSQFTLRDYVYVNAQAVYADGQSDIVSRAFYVGDPDYDFPLVFVAEPTEGGTITGPDTANGGQTVNFTVTPNEGYTLKSVTAKYTEFGNAYGGNDIVIDGNSFTMPAYTKIDVKNENRVFITATFVSSAVAQPGDEVTFNYKTGEEFAQTNQQDLLDSEKNGITIDFDKGTGSNVPKWYTATNGNARVYGGNTITITAPSAIETVTFTYDNTSNVFTDATTVEPGTLSDAVWTVGDSEGVMSVGSTVRIATITVKLSEVGAILPPVISGTTPFIGETEVTITNPNESGSIYYTTDGGDPTAEDEIYNGPFTITESTTVKAIVVDGDKVSDIAIKEFEATQTVNSIAEFVETTGTVVFTNPVVVLGQAGTNLYVQDDSNFGMIVYGSVGKTYSLGDVIPSGFTGTYQFFRGMHELTNPKGFNDASGDQQTPVAIEVEPDGISTANSGRYAVIKNATISGNTIVVGEKSVAMFNRFNWTAPEDLTKTYDIYGITSMYATSNNAEPYAQFMPLSFKESQVTPETYTVTTTVTEGEGTIQILNDGNAFIANDLIEFSVTPGEGYELDHLSVFCETSNQAIVPTLEEGVYSFNMPADNVIISASFRESVAPLWLIGNVNDVGWHTNNGAQMNYDAENEVYTLDITVENASEGFGWFGIVTALTENDNDWDNLNENRLSAGENNANDFVVNYRNHNNIALVPFSQAPHSFQLLMGNYTVIIDKELTTMQIVGEFNTPNYYLIGSYNSWQIDDSRVQLVYNEGTGKFEATQPMVANAEFKLIDDQGVWYGGDSEGNFIVTPTQVEEGTPLSIIQGGGNNLQIPVAGNWTFSFDDTNMKLVISGIWKNPTTLAEILATAEADDDVIVANDLAIVDIVADQHIAFATDGEGNWIELSMDSDVLDFVEATPTLAGGSIKGTFIYDGFNPTIVIEEMPEAAQNDITVEPAVYPVNLDFAPKPCEIFYVTGYYHGTGGTDNGPNLREWSGNGGQMGVLLDLDLSWARGSMEDGKHYKIRGTALLKEAWEAPSADGIRPRMATDDPMALRNYTIMATDIPDTPTAIETLVKNVEAKRVRYYNLQGVELNAPANGLNIIVIEHNDGSITTHKVLN